MFLRLLEDFDKLGRALGEVREYPLIQMKSDKEKVILRAQLPGLSEKDIDISLTDDVIEISEKLLAERKRPTLKDKSRKVERRIFKKNRTPL